MKRYIVFILLISCLLSTSHAQNTNTVYFMEDVAERNNNNPALTPTCNFYLDFIFLPNMYFALGNDNFMLRDFIYNQNGVTQTFLGSNDAIDRFYNNIKPVTDINANLNLNVLSFGFQAKKSYFTFDFGIHADASIFIPKDIFKFLLYGTPDEHNVNTFDLSKIGVNASLYSSIGLGYMYQINKKLTIGAKAKFLMGYANINTDINKLHLNASRKEWSLETDGRINASLPITYDVANDGSINFESIQLQNTNDLITLLYKPAGIGAAIDLGFKYEPIKNLVISASVTDLGMIYWTKNSISASMQGYHSIDKFVDYSVGDTLSTEAIIDDLSALGTEILNTIHTDGENRQYKTKLHANVFTAVEYGILKNQISLGVVNRLKFKHYIQDEVTVALNLRPTNWLKATISHSFLNGHYSNIGFGINIRAGIMNMHIIADYIPTSFAKIPLNMEELPINNILVTNCSKLFNVQMGWTWNIGQHANDMDRDGVKRAKDKCPETNMDFLRKQCPGLHKKEFVDKQGCEYDDDQDGVHNCYDQCPDTPLGTAVNSEGCTLIDSNN